MSGFRFETYENVITKHTLSKLHWTQVAKAAFHTHFDQADWTVSSVRQVNDHTIEIIKRKDQNKTVCYNWGFDQKGIYERVVIDRNEETVAIDRLDMNWKISEPFMGRRDLFMPAKRAENSIDFIRHDFWLPKVLKFDSQLMSGFCAWGYKRQFRKQEAIKQ